MIAELIIYGSALYWALLFVGVYMLTIYADERKDTLRAGIWASTILIYVFGFTSYNPESIELILGIIVYIILGALMATVKWLSLVGRISEFAKTYEPLSTDRLDLRHMLDKAFCPNNVRDGVMMLPPDPYEFRTRLTMWFLYWPVFIFFRPLAYFHRAVTSRLWRMFQSISTRIYDNTNIG